MAPEIRKVGVLGCGLMGSGIAQVAAGSGYATVAREVEEAPLARGRSAIEKSLAKLVERNKLSPSDRDAALARLAFTTDLSALADCDLVIEAVTEDLALKNRLWAELDARCPAHTIFASNTSSLTIGAMAAATTRADRFVGLHFFNPVPLMPLVEVVRALTTSRETLERSLAFARSLGKETVVAKVRTERLVAHRAASSIAPVLFYGFEAVWRSSLFLERDDNEFSYCWSQC